MQKPVMPESITPIINITGSKVALGPIRRDLIPLYTKWINDFEVTRTIAMGMQPATHDAEESWYEATARNDRVMMFTIYELPTMRPIGNTSLHRIDYFHRVADVGIMIGEKDSWNKGYGTEATSLILDYGFNALGLHSIMLLAYAYNQRAIRAYTRAGFKIVGRRREARLLGGKAYDEVYMDCLATEFKSPLLGDILDSNRIPGS